MQSTPCHHACVALSIRGSCYVTPEGLRYHALHTLQTLNPTTAGAHGPAHLDARIDAFLSAFQGALRRLSPDELEGHRAALVASKTLKDASLLDEADRNWEQISNKRCAAMPKKIQYISSYYYSISVDCFLNYIVDTSILHRCLGPKRLCHPLSNSLLLCEGVYPRVMLLLSLLASWWSVFPFLCPVATAVMPFLWACAQV